MEANNQNLEEIIANDLAQNLQQEIDSDLLADMMVSIGWTRVTMPFEYRYTSLQKTLEIRLWLSKNSTGDYKMLGTSYIVFEKQQDANWFKLRWGA